MARSVGMELTEDKRKMTKDQRSKTKDPDTTLF